MIFSFQEILLALQGTEKLLINLSFASINLICFFEDGLSVLEFTFHYIFSIIFKQNRQKANRNLFFFKPQNHCFSVAFTTHLASANQTSQNITAKDIQKLDTINKDLQKLKNLCQFPSILQQDIKYYKIMTENNKISTDIEHCFNKSILFLRTVLQNPTYLGMENSFMRIDLGQSTVRP